MLPKVIATFIFSLITLYLGYHSLHGQRGYYAWQIRKQELAQLQSKEKKLLFQHHDLQVKVNLLQDNIDTDLLEQYIWILFRNISPEKKVILYP